MQAPFGLQAKRSFIKGTSAWPFRCTAMFSELHLGAFFLLLRLLLRSLLSPYCACAAAPSSGDKRSTRKALAAKKARFPCRVTRKVTMKLLKSKKALFFSSARLHACCCHCKRGTRARSATRRRRSSRRHSRKAVKIKGSAFLFKR